MSHISNLQYTCDIPMDAHLQPQQSFLFLFFPTYTQTGTRTQHEGTGKACF